MRLAATCAEMLRVTSSPRLCEVDETINANADGGNEVEPVKETLSEALQRVFISQFGAQVAGLAVLFAIFLYWSSTALTDDLWLTPF